MAPTRLVANLLLLVVELVDKLVELEVLLLSLEKRLDELVDVFESRGLLQLLKCLLEPVVGFRVSGF